jgi:ribosome-associated protein
MTSEQSSTVKEQSLHPEQSTGKHATSDLSANKPVELDERIRLALAAASDKKAMDPVVLDLRSIASFTDFFIVTSGANVRQVQAIADEVVEQLKKQGERAARVEGYNSAEWVLVDYGDFIVHVFDDKARRFYDLERLWREATKVPLPPEIAGSQTAAPESGRS